MAKKAEIIEKARIMFLMPDDKGDHKYSLSDIANELGVTKTSVFRWSQKYHWVVEWDNEEKEGIVTAVVERAVKAVKASKKAPKKDDALVVTQCRTEVVRQSVNHSMNIAQLTGELLEEYLESLNEELKKYDSVRDALSLKDLERINNIRVGALEDLRRYDDAIDMNATPIEISIDEGDLG